MPFSEEYFLAGLVYSAHSKIIDAAPRITINEAGISIVDCTYIKNYNIRQKSNPLTVSYFALDYYKMYIKNHDIKYRKLFLI